jgi:o-succinylbenzoate---CoA ligase
MLNYLNFSLDNLFRNLVNDLSLKLTSNYPSASRIIIAESDPVKFLASFLAACTAKYQVFLCNPDWGDNEWRQVLDLVQPDVIWGIEKKIPRVVVETLHVKSLQHQDALIMIPTGGSSGKIKFTVHTWETLTASVRGFAKYFQVSQVNSVCLLPLYHVSGLMQFIRAYATGGQLAIWNYKQLISGEIPDIDPSNFFISLVPTQLQRFLDNPQLTIWLSKFDTVLLGGAPAWDDLLEKAKCHNIRLAPTYGMTETASQIATLKPDDFLDGKRGCGQVLPHARVLICDENNQELAPNQVGKIIIQAESLFLGYYGKNDDCQFDVDDVGYFNEQGYLNIVGRNSNKIITGGENVFPEEVEAAILATDMVNDVCVIGTPDNYWGQVVTAVYVPKYPNTSIFAIETLLKYSLSKYKVPKYWVAVSMLPRNLQGKVNRGELVKIAIECL